MGFGPCMNPQCKAPILSAGGGAGHRSDCAVHNAPAYPAGHCDCGFVAVQPDAAAIKSAAFEIAVIMELHAATGSTTKAKAEDIERGIRALIDKPGKEVMPLDAGTTQTQTQAHDIGPGDQAVAGAAPMFGGKIVNGLIDAIDHARGFANAGTEHTVAAPPPWPENLFGLTNTRRFHVDCATEGCGRRVSTRFAGSDYCEPCGRKVAALAQKGDSHE
jgi:hypothetical protein